MVLTLPPSAISVVICRPFLRARVSSSSTKLRLHVAQLERSATRAQRRQFRMESLRADLCGSVVFVEVTIVSREITGTAFFRAQRGEFGGGELLRKQQSSVRCAHRGGRGQQRCKKVEGWVKRGHIVVERVVRIKKLRRVGVRVRIDFVDTVRWLMKYRVNLVSNVRLHGGRRHVEILPLLPLCIREYLSEVEGYPSTVGDRDNGRRKMKRAKQRNRWLMRSEARRERWGARGACGGWGGRLHGLGREGLQR